VSRLYHRENAPARSPPPFSIAAGGANGDVGLATADTVALGDVLEDRDGLLLREMRADLALGEAVLARPAAEHAAGLVGP
jgi:hypothetical protein